MRCRVRRGEDDGAGQVARGEGASLPGVPEGASLAGRRRRRRRMERATRAQRVPSIINEASIDVLPS